MSSFCRINSPNYWKFSRFLPFESFIKSSFVVLLELGVESGFDCSFCESFLVSYLFGVFESECPLPFEVDDDDILLLTGAIGGEDLVSSINDCRSSSSVVIGKDVLGVDEMITAEKFG